MARKKWQSKIVSHIRYDGTVVYKKFTVGWCDCEKPAVGFTRRDDGCWVRPCCMRRSKQVFDLFGDNPVPADYAQRVSDAAVNKLVSTRNEDSQ
jgi:hypothetical protein